MQTWEHGWLSVSNSIFGHRDALWWTEAAVDEPELISPLAAPGTENTSTYDAVRDAVVARCERAKIASLGLNGWELVCVVGATWFFKRASGEYRRGDSDPLPPL